VIAGAEGWFDLSAVLVRAMNISEHDQVKENLLIEGLQDFIHLSEIHTAFMFDDRTPKRPRREAQEMTLNMIRELVNEGLFVLGVPNKKDPTGFTRWDLPLESAIAEIEEAYVKNFDDRWGWVTIVWLNQTDKGKKLALELYHVGEPWP
jgi:hypothetical protein